MAYITDAKHIDEDVIDRLHGIGTLIINSLRIKEHISHMTLAETLNVIKRVNPARAYLIHMSHDMGKESQAAHLLPPNTEFAYDGLIIKI